MEAIGSWIQAGVGGLGFAIIYLLFKMWRNGDLVPRVVVDRLLKADEIREAARRAESEQNRKLMTALTEVLEQQMSSRARHSRDY